MAGALELNIPGIMSSMAVERPDVKQSAPTSSDREVPKQLTDDKPEEQNGLDEEAVTGVADALNSVAKAIDRNLEFSVDKESGRIIIKVTDGETGEVIRMVPPNDIKQMQQSFGSLVGLLFNQES